MKKQSHIAKVVTGYVGPGAAGDKLYAEMIQKAYAELNDEATATGMVIVNQAVSVVSLQPDRVCYLIVCQWVSRADLESMNMRNSLLGGNHKLGGTN